jgi:hypothetical protein
MLFLSVCVSAATVCFSGSVSAQMIDRDRVVKTSSSRPTNLPPAAAAAVPQKVVVIPTARPTLTNEISVKKDAAYEPLVKNTASSIAMNSAAVMAAAGKSAYSLETSNRLDRAIKSLYGIPYRYGSFLIATAPRARTRTTAQVLSGRRFSRPASSSHVQVHVLYGVSRRRLRETKDTSSAPSYSLTAWATWASSLTRTASITRLPARASHTRLSKGIGKKGSWVSGS